MYKRQALSHDELVYFNAGEYERLVAMSMHDYKSLVAPIVLTFAHEINSNIRCAPRLQPACMMQAWSEVK